MRFATYNVWNADEGMPQREKYIIDEIINCKADILCLQEVRDRMRAERIACEAGYRYFFFDNYQNENEGLEILSKIPFDKCASWLSDTNAIFSSFAYNDSILAIVNLHLPWKGSLKRENQIIDIMEHIQMERFDYILLMGDFNCSDKSDVYRFLTGDCSLKNKEANPCWYDLASAYADLTQTPVDSTLNFRRNPRFTNNTIEVNQRFDRIMLRNTYPNEFPILKQCSTFGQRIYSDIALSASDHYGVVVEIEASKPK